MRISIFLFILMSLAVLFTGCRKKQIDNPQPQSQSEFSDEPTKQIQQTSMSISDNPAFFTATAISPRAAEVKDIDKLLKPILAQLFDDAKLIEESEAPKTKADGEVVKNSMAYVVRLTLTPQEGDNLHSALKKTGFTTSTVHGGKPLHYKSTVTMSLMKTTSAGSYSLAITVDSLKQRIEVTAYKLSSKYDGMSQTSASTAGQKQPAIERISDNPAFFTATAVNPESPVAKDLGNLLRPVLTNIFEEVKLVEESQAPQTKIDGEVVENRLVYVVRLLLTPKEGDNLHAALKKIGFVSSPRLGRKPTHYTSGTVMSLMKSTSLRGYSLVINVDAGKQQIEIESYKLGSKYDRM